MAKIHERHISEDSLFVIIFSKEDPGGRKMKLRSKAPILRDWTGTAHFTTDYPISEDGKPVLVTEGPNGKPVEPAEAYVYGYEVLEASDKELEMLREGGYAIPYLGR